MPLKLSPKAQGVREAFRPKEVIESLTSYGARYFHSELPRGRHLVVWYDDRQYSPTFSAVGNEELVAFWRSFDSLTRYVLGDRGHFAAHGAVRKLVRIGEDPELIKRERQRVAMQEFALAASEALEGRASEEQPLPVRGRLFDEVVRPLQGRFSQWVSMELALRVFADLLTELDLDLPEPVHADRTEQGLSEFGDGKPNHGWLGDEAAYQAAMNGVRSEYHRRKNSDYQ